MTHPMRNLRWLGICSLAFLASSCRAQDYTAPLPTLPTRAATAAPTTSEGLTLVRAQQAEVVPPAPNQTVSTVPSPRQPGSSVPSGNGVPDNLGTLRISICARVNGQPIFCEDVFSGAMRQLYDISKLSEPERSHARHKLLKQQLEQLIDREVILQDAYRKLSKSPRFMDKLREIADKQFQKSLRDQLQRTGLTELQFRDLMVKQGSSLESQRKLLEREIIASEYMRGRIQPILEQIGHPQIREYYQTHMNQFQTFDKVVWENIFISADKPGGLAQARTLAEQLVKQLQAGVPMSKLTQYDDGDSKFRNGQGFGQLKGEIKPAELEPYLFQMQPGDIGPRVELATGVHIFRLVQREYGGQQGFTEEVQNKVRSLLRSEIGNRESRRLVRELSSQAVIEIDYDALK